MQTKVKFISTNMTEKSGIDKDLLFQIRVRSSIAFYRMPYDPVKNILINKVNLIQVLLKGSF
jgi:hypothetical protein